MFLFCLPGVSLSKAILCSERLFKGQSVLRTANRGPHPRLCREPGRSPLKVYEKLNKIRRPSKTGIRSAFLYYESPWSLPGCSKGPFLPPWCLPGCPLGPCLPPWCLPGASQTVKMALSYPPGASLVPRKLSDASLVPPCPKQACGPSGSLKASLCYGQPTVEPTPGPATNRADRH